MQPSVYQDIVWQSIEEWMGELPLFFHVSGNCMAPALLNRSKVEVTTSGIPWPGDIVLVKPGAGAKPYLHRLIGCYRRHGMWYYVTQADNYSIADVPVPERQLVGTLCGGECASSLVKVPFRHRCWAASRFINYVVRRLAGKTWCLLRGT